MICQRIGVTSVAEAGYLTVRVQRDGLVCVLAVSGELDVLTAGRFAEAAAAAVETPAERLVLDLSGLRFTDCCGARALAATARAAAVGCPVIVRSVSPAVRRVLDLAGLNLESRGLAPGSADRLWLETQWLHAWARHNRHQSRQLAETVAATQDKVADTLIQLADRRPHRAGELAARSQIARTRAAQFRGLTTSGRPAGCTPP